MHEAPSLFSGKKMKNISNGHLLIFLFSSSVIRGESQTKLVVVTNVNAEQTIMILFTETATNNHFSTSQHAIAYI